ncbi:MULTISPECIES: hypothetical protein [Mycobacteriaceae]|uniref:hypothetical protein n=1 Tax=Mycobacteriaceae TaxID=1762 RepID=UPI000E1FF255|nr:MULTISPECIES: hypothetical protein [Mycobacteriaceae]AXK77465.1 hypothetical protein DXK33_22550 [Mycolicibacterium neoaurum]
MKRSEMTSSVGVLALLAAIASAPAAQAATVVNGTATCKYYSNGALSRPVGMWVEAIGGGQSGWAALTPNGTSSNFSYSTNGASKFILHVGCGGTPQNWASNIPTVPVVGYTTVTVTW